MGCSILQPFFMPMEIRELATLILSATTLEEKLFFPQLITDISPGPPLIWDVPTRPAGMGFTRKKAGEKLPPLHAIKSTDETATCLHRFAGHELLAVELMAYALLAFPDAPQSIRRGICNTLHEEQGHVLLYTKRLQELGCEFGCMPLYEHFWRHTKYFTSIKSYICAMSLTFEMANLDFAPAYGNAFQQQGDAASAKVMKQILDDEIKHVAFGVSSLRRLEPTNMAPEALYEAYVSHLPPLIHPKRAKGKWFAAGMREKAHVPSIWIEKIKAL